MSYNQGYTGQYVGQYPPQQQQQHPAAQGMAPNPYSGVQLQQQQQQPQTMNQPYAMNYNGRAGPPMQQQQPPQQHQAQQAYGSPYQGQARGYPQNAQKPGYNQVANQAQLAHQQQAYQAQAQARASQAQLAQGQGMGRPAGPPQNAAAIAPAAASPQVTNSGGPVTSAAMANPGTVSNEFSTADKVLDALEKLDPAESTEERQLQRLVKEDAVYEKTLESQTKLEMELLRKKQVELDYYSQARMYRQQQIGLVFGEGYQGYGNGWTGREAILRYPGDRKRVRKLRRSRELIVLPRQAELIAQVEECLCPVRLDFSSDRYRLRDTFTWNINDKIIDVNMFVENLLEDFGIPGHFTNTVAATVKEQLNEFHPHAFSQSAPDSAVQDDDMRIVIKLDITIGQHNLTDQFEWDMNCPDNNPEAFAEQMCRELSLSGEFVTAIAHAIREQTQLHTKSLFLTGHPFDGSAIDDEDIRRELCPVVTTSEMLRAKSVVKEFTPQLYEIPDVELDRQDKDRDRDSRRKRRQGRAGRRGGPVLPDLRESVRTFRTPVYSAILPGGIDRNLELLRKYAIQADNSDDEDDDEMSGYGGSSSSRRLSRRAAHAAQAAISGQIQYNNNPHSSVKFASTPTQNGLGRPPLHRLAMQNAHARGRSVSLSASSPPREDIGSFMVVLKVPNLRAIMDRKGYVT